MTHQLLDAIYDRGLRKGEWRPALTQLRDLLGSAEIALTVVVPDAPRPALWETTGAVLTSRECEKYAREFWRLDPKMPLLADRGTGFVFNDIDHFDDSFVSKNQFYQEYSLPLGFRHTLDLFADSYEGGDVYLAAMRGPAEGPYDDVAAMQLRASAAHFVRALKARRDIARAERAACHAESALDALPFGIAIVNASGSVLFANEFARNAFEANCCIDPSRNHAADNPLPRKLHDAVQGRPADFRLRRGEEWLVSAVPLGGASRMAADTGAAAMLIYRRASQPRLPAAEALKVMYGLTDAEAEIALGVAGGKSLVAIARLRNVKLSTVRWQLLAVLRKLGVGRQADVIRLLTAMTATDV